MLFESLIGLDGQKEELFGLDNAKSMNPTMSTDTILAFLTVTAFNY